MSDFYTGNQKRNAIRTEFVNLAAGEDGVVSWDLCEGLITKYYPDTSSTRLEQLLYEADEDSVEEIKLENFMVVIQQLSNETNICDPLDIVEGSMH